MGEVVLERTAGRVAGLSGSLGEGNQRREEQHEIQIEAAENPVQVDAHVHFGRQASSERGFVDEGDTLVLQVDGRVHDTVDRRINPQNSVAGLPQGLEPRRIRREIDRGRSEPAERTDLGFDGGIDRSPADPYQSSLVALEQEPAPHLPDTAGAADNDVDAALPVRGERLGQTGDARQTLAEPFALAIRQAIALFVSGP